MSTNTLLKNLARDRNYAPVARGESLVSVDRELQDVRAGAKTQLFENNPFAGHFDYVQYQYTDFKTYESLADPETQKKPIEHIAVIAANVNPHMKAAMTDFQDYCVGGWGFKNRTIVVDRFLDTMEDEFDGFDSYLSNITHDLFLHSQYFSESVYDDFLHLRRMIANDVMSLEYKQQKDHPLGDRYVAGQRQGFGSRGWKMVQDDPTVITRRLYSKPNYPYGVPFVTAAVFHMVMMVEFFKSYKYLLDSFVMPNLFFRVDREIVEKVVTDPTKRGGFVKKVFNQLMQQVKKFGPGRIITMGSEVMDPEILSGMNDKTMGSAEALINALDNQLELALKTHGLTTLRNDSALNDTKAKYRMANYARVIKRGQRVIVGPHNRQFNRAHIEAGMAGTMCGFYLERNIYEDEQILAEISKTMSDSRSAGYDALDKLLDLLDKAVVKGRMTEAQANMKFAEEMGKIEQQIDLADLNEFD